MPPDREEERQRALRALLAAEGLDGLIVTQMANVRYLTGFTGSSAVAVVLARETLLFTDTRYALQAAEEVKGRTRVEIAEADLWAGLWRALGGYSEIATLGFESHAISYGQGLRVLQAETPVTRRGVEGLVERLRARKDPEEVAAIREAARLVGEALEAALSCVRPGMQEREIAAVVEHELRRRGSEWHPFPTIVASGPRSALPHAGTSARVVHRGELLLVDVGARVDGYCADLTRTVVVGRADERQRTVYGIVQAAQRAAVAGLRAGMSGREADAVARRVIEDHGFGDAFGHSLGHGIGLELHEAPRLSRQNEDALPAGAVVTVEPGIYIAGWGGVRIEDDVLLSADGAELLSAGEAGLRELD